MNNKKAGVQHLRLKFSRIPGIIISNSILLLAESGEFIPPHNDAYASCIVRAGAYRTY